MTKPGQTDLKQTSDDDAKAILVVEDDTKLLGNVVEYLAVEGFSVLSATSATRACELLGRHPIALVLLDWDLSGGRTSPSDPGTGDVVLKACRQIDPFIPVIVMSGLQSVDARTDAVLAQADSFLAKPFSLNLLTNHLRHWIGRMAASRPLCPLAREEDVLPFEELKRRYVRAVVRLLDGNVAQAARRLKLHRHTVAALLAADAAPADNDKPEQEAKS
jgi:DNA-binding response OmpR family regulator